MNADRVCSKIVGALGTNVTVLNALPFGRWIVGRYHARHAALIYGNVAAVDAAHSEQRRPPRNVAFCKLVAAVAPTAMNVLELGAGRAVNANILAADLPAATFTMVDAFIDASRYAEPGVRCRPIVGDVDDVEVDSRFDVGLTRAFLSILPPAQARSALDKMARRCPLLVLNEATADSDRSIIRPDRRFAHPYRRWLEGWTMSVTGSGDPAYDAFIVARR